LEQAPQNNGIFSIAKKNNLSSPYFQIPLKKPCNTGIISLHHGRLMASTVCKEKLSITMSISSKIKGADGLSLLLNLL